VDAEALKSWVALRNVPGVGDRLFKRLIERFDDPRRVFEAARQAPQRLDHIEGVHQGLVHAIARQRLSQSLWQDIESALEQGIQIVTLADRCYPTLLKEIADPPAYFFIAGQLPQDTDMVAMVGSRNATGYGLEICRRLSHQLASQGICVVSGMALGIDTAAHRGALAARGTTVAVLGSGLNRIYPWQNRALFKEICATGGAISEFGLQAEPDAHNFPKRNRIISGMCLGTVVVEAARRSGSLITARLAAEQHREVFAVPGSIDSFKSSGTHSLIQQGAKLITSVNDIIEELIPRLRGTIGTGLTGQNKAPPDLSEAERSLFERIGAYPVHVDDLVRGTRMAAGTVASTLLQLELKGLIVQQPGKQFIRSLEFLTPAK
jgi:DNA processing protein